jgi:small redox-active disulfide protein 2
MTGIIGLKAALTEMALKCKGMTDDQIGKALLDMLSRSNYIESGLNETYAQALVREYKKYIGTPVTEPHDQVLSIKVLGQGCAQCNKLERDVMTVMSENGIAADLEHIRDVAEIARLGVMGVPALLINGQVKAVGSVPPRDKIQKWIVKAAEDIQQSS